MIYWNEVVNGRMNGGLVELLEPQLERQHY
jgi:hypothetical protein